MTMAVGELCAVWVSLDGHTSIVSSQRLEQRPSLKLFMSLSIQHRLAKNGSTGPNCSVLRPIFAKCLSRPWQPLSGLDPAKLLIGSWLPGSFVVWDRCAEASRGERHSKVNYELAARPRHSQRSLTF
jgi:hypothetical protein